MILLLAEGGYLTEGMAKSCCHHRWHTIRMCPAEVCYSTVSSFTIFRCGMPASMKGSPTTWNPARS